MAEEKPVKPFAPGKVKPDQKTIRKPVIRTMPADLERLKKKAKGEEAPPKMKPISAEPIKEEKVAEIKRGLSKEQKKQLKGFLKEGESLFKKKEYQGAIEKLEAVLKIDPKFKKAKKLIEKIKKEQSKPAKKEKPTEKKPTPAKATAGKEEKPVKLKKPRKKFILIIIIIIILAGGGFGLYYWLSQPSTTVTPPPAPSLIKPSPLVPTDKEIIIKLEAGQNLLAELKTFVSASLPKSSQILVYDQTSDKPLEPIMLKDLFQKLGIQAPEKILTNLKDNYTFLIISHQGLTRLGLIAQTAYQQEQDFSVDFKSWEETMSQDLEPLFLVSAGQPASATFTDNVYQETNIRYLNFPSPDLTLDYAFWPAKNYLLLATSRQGIYTIIDKLITSSALNQ